MSLLDEFFLQGDKERDLGLPFSPLCDRNNTLVAESQIGFIEFIVEPSMGVCADMLECILGPMHSSSNKTTNNSAKPINEENTGKAINNLFNVLIKHCVNKRSLYINTKQYIIISCTFKSVRWF